VTPKLRARAGPELPPGKLPFDIHRVIRRLRAATRTLPRAAMFALADEGHHTLFEQLVACIISVRTRDEVSLPAAQRLFERARTPEAMARLSETAIDERIRDVTFHQAKARQILLLARRAAAEHGGRIPCDAQVVRSFPGVGPKCANLALSIACAAPLVSVDIHVHRVTNRWGYVQARAPEETLRQLEQKLPGAYRAELNALLVPFGKWICTGRLPRCSTCPVLAWCRQVRVTEHR
jgi:endonuclease-3